MSPVTEPTADDIALQADGCTRVAPAELVGLRQQLPRRLSARVDARHAQRMGTHAGSVRGRGMDYRESRAYQPGDDVRRLDWRLTARSGRMHTKLFQEDRERSLMLLVDTHAGMQFGTRRRFKSVQAARAGAVAAWLAVAAGMRVGVAGLGASRMLIRPRAGVHGALGVMHALCRLQGATARATAADAEPLSAALQRLARLARGGSEVMLISDGFSTDAAARTEMVRLRRFARIGVLIVADALETGLPPAGRYPLSWQDALHRVDLTSPGERVAFRQALGAGPRQLQALASSLALPWAPLDTVQEPLSAVAGLLGARLYAGDT